ncbi:MAG: sigma-70 family RNA polymerase sigma factor [Planctomycetes bacterium]|nr:sigma-70 family RNA polymerase sigma factor [Planctomycetota bacterium]
MTDTFASDLELVRAARDGHPRAIEALTQRLAILPACVRNQNANNGRRLQRDEEEDVVQNVAVSLWRKLDAFDGRAPLETWAYGFVCIEVLRALDRKARRARVLSIDDELDAAAPEAAHGADARESVELALEHVAGAGAEIVRLKHFQELTFEEIAARRREPLNTIKTRYYRALERLRSVLHSAFEERHERA